MDQKCHHHRTDQHNRRPHTNADGHLERLLHVHHVRGHPGHKPCRGKLIYVGEGKSLNPLIHCLPQIHGKAGAGAGCRLPGFHAEK